MTHLLLGLALVAGAPAPKAEPKKETPTLVGEWVGETGVRSGQPEPPPPGTLMLFAADGKMVLGEGGIKQKIEGTYTTDPKKTPNELNLVPMGIGQGVTFTGIYKIDGDTLTICFTTDGKRPTEFASPAGSAAMLITLKRVKKE